MPVRPLRADRQPRYGAVRAGSGCRYCNGTAIKPAAATALMRQAGLEPPEDYPGALRPWPCRCLKCNRTVRPCYSTIQRGSGGCRWCWNSGFKSGDAAVVYLITHTSYGSAKVGITDAAGSRITRHVQRGWRALVTVSVPGEVALAIEKEILDWWRAELALAAYLGRQEMPQGGWTETVDAAEIDPRSHHQANPRSGRDVTARRPTPPQSFSAVLAQAAVRSG
jgi:hypothetical protein